MRPPRVLGWLLLALGVPGALPRADEPPAVPAVPTLPEARYRTSAEVAQRLEALAVPDGAPRPGWSLRPYGTSGGGRPLLALRVGAEGLPVVLVHGGLGPRDAAASAACLHLAERLAMGEDPAAASVAWLLIPAPNPDALDAFLAGKPRAGGVDVDRDRDGRSGEDGPDDLDGDGEILTMRRATPRGPYAGDETPPKDGKVLGDPRLLAEKGVDVRRPRSYEVSEEGRDDDGDGDVNEDPPGLDLRRQMSGWTDAKGPWAGDGPFPGLAPEAKALMDLSFETPALVAWYGFTGTGDQILRASENGKVADEDDALYGKVAEALRAAAGLEVKRASEVLRGDNPGSDLDWAAAHLWIPAFRIPVWRIPKEAGSGRERAFADELDWLLWNDRVLGGRGFAPWTPFVHPTLGPVEIGGWRRFSRHEPPADLLAPAVAAVSGVPRVHAAFRPILEILVEGEAAGGDLFRVLVRAANRGGAPTDTASAARRNRAMGVRATLVAADGVVVLGGPKVADLGVVDAGEVSGEAQWLVRRAGAGPLGRVTLRHRAAGVVSKEVATP